jgi:hypothetical protein
MRNDKPICASLALAGVHIANINCNFLTRRQISYF